MLNSPSCTTAPLASLLSSVAPSSWTGLPAPLTNVMNDPCPSRSNPQQAAQKLNSASETLKKENTKLWIFPEGTRFSEKNLKMLSFARLLFILIFIVQEWGQKYRDASIQERCFPCGCEFKSAYPTNRYKSLRI